MGSVPMPVCAPQVVLKPAYFAMRSAMMADVTLSISRPPYASGMSTPLNPSSPAFFSRSRSDGEILVLHLLDVGHDFVDREFFRGLRDELVLLGEIFRSEDFVGLAFLDQEAAAGNLGGGCCTKRSHLRSPSEMYSCGSVQHEKRIHDVAHRRITHASPMQSLRSADKARH